MCSKLTVPLALMVATGCAHVQRGPTPLYYRPLGDVPQRGVVAPVAEVPRHEVHEKPKSSNPTSIIYKRIPTDLELRRAAELSAEKNLSQPVPEKSVTDREKEEKRLNRLLEMKLISREEYERKMGINPQEKR